ncbi:MAG: hypothetical protein ABL936_17515, partial [Aestuariivirga sp.]
MVKYSPGFESQAPSIAGLLNWCLMPPPFLAPILEPRRTPNNSHKAACDVRYGIEIGPKMQRVALPLRAKNGHGNSIQNSREELPT